MSITQEKIKRQLELEYESVELGVKRYREQIAKTPLSDMPPGVALTKRAMEPMRKALEAFMAPSRGGSRLHQTRKLLEEFDDLDDVAFIVAKVLISHISLRETLTNVAITLSSAILDHLEYLRFKAQEPKFLAYIERSLKTGHRRHRRTVILRAKRKAGIEDAHWTKADKVQLGIKLIELFIESTGLIEKVRDANEQWVLQGTDEAVKWIQEQHARCELLSPMILPMIIPPRRWESPFGGGFLSNEATLTFRLVKTDNMEYLNSLAEHDMPEVYAAVNAVQETPWRINKRVFEVMQEAWRLDNGTGGLPVDQEEPLPPTPWYSDEEFQRLKQENPEVVTTWKRQAALVYQRRIAHRTKRFAAAQRLWVAEKFKDEPEIYFVWNLDWRGRMYPVQAHVNPQTEDAGRALLEFAQGKPLGERGAFWLAVHLANKFGEDKVSFEDRVKWVKEHEEEILDSAQDPLGGMRFWEQADDPWCFLAACFEWQGYKEQGESFVSHIPIAMDGTCNGLQHFSAMLLDEVGGKAVNLVPMDLPQDVYSEVAKVVSKMVEQDAAEGDEMAQLWVGKVDRGIAKRNVMTVPYGATLHGMKDQLLDEVQKRSTRDQPYLDTDDPYKACQYLGEVMYEGIGKVVVAAREAMNWLQESVRIASRADTPIRWVTPAGFPVLQSYYKTRLKDVRAFWGTSGIRIRVSLREDTETLDRRKQASGISPNYVHSMDASHLMLTVNKAVEHGIRHFALIHDSYGTHAADTDTLNRLLREAFVEQYTQEDALKRFQEQLIEQLPPEIAEKLPPIPEKGGLDLAKVQDSRYFFA